MKRFASCFLAVLILFSCMPTAFAEKNTTPTASNISVAVCEGEFFDPSEVLNTGTKSDDGQYVTYNGSTFAVKDMLNLIAALDASVQQAPHIAPYAYGKETVKVRSNTFYSRGSQHRVAVQTLNANQTGAFQLTATASHQITASAGVDIEWFRAQVGYAYQTTTSVSSRWDIGPLPYRNHQYLSTVFIVHEYDIYDNTIFNGRVYLGSAQYYEPFSFYTYAEKA